VENGPSVADPERLQAFLRTSAAHGRTVVESPPFTAFLDPRDALRFVNYAIPDRDVEPEREAVERLREIFLAHDRLPRLEWVEEAAPRVADALAAAGMTEELRAPLMTCTPDELVEARADVADLAVSDVGDADLRELANVQRVAFGLAALETEDEPGNPRTHGGGAVLARAGGEPVAAATWTPVVDGVSEPRSGAVAGSPASSRRRPRAPRSPRAHRSACSRRVTTRRSACTRAPASRRPQRSCTGRTSARTDPTARNCSTSVGVVKT
jgi:hypothetical protein